MRPCTHVLELVADTATPLEHQHLDTIQCIQCGGTWPLHLVTYTSVPVTVPDPDPKPAPETVTYQLAIAWPWGHTTRAHTRPLTNRQRALQRMRQRNADLAQSNDPRRYILLKTIS